MISVYVFQSTHPRGVRPTNCEAPIPASCFNPRTREGVRLLKHGVDWPSFVVSIHAPTRGATITDVEDIWRLIGFNPRTHEGCDRQAGILWRIYLSFNPRTHEGCDWRRLRTSRHQKGFNPRTHEGCDKPFCPTASRQAGFNPRTHEGCDSQLQTIIQDYHSFNPRTHEGCDS